MTNTQPNNPDLLHWQHIKRNDTYYLMHGNKSIASVSPHTDPDLQGSWRTAVSPAFEDVGCNGAGHHTAEDARCALQIWARQYYLPGRQIGAHPG